MNARDAKRLTRSLILRGRGRCNLCDKKVRFKSIDRTLVRSLSECEFPYSLDEFETLNRRRYLCPVCGSTDRDRLYKPHVEPGGLLRVVEFTPAHRHDPGDATGRFRRGSASPTTVSVSAASPRATTCASRPP